MATSMTRLLAALTGVAACCALAGEMSEGVAAGAPADLMELVQWHAGFGVADGFCSDVQAGPLGGLNAGSATALLAMHGALGLQYAEGLGSAGSLDATSLPKGSRKPARGSASARDPSVQRVR